LENLDFFGGNDLAARGDAGVGDSDKPFFQIDAETESNDELLVDLKFQT